MCDEYIVNFLLNDLVVQDLVAHDKIVSCGRGFIRSEQNLLFLLGSIKQYVLHHLKFPMKGFLS